MPIHERFSRGKIEIVNRSSSSITECNFSGAASSVFRTPIGSGQSKHFDFDIRSNAIMQLRLSIALSSGKHHTYVQPYFGNLTSIQMIIEEDGIHPYTLVDGYL